MRVCMCALWLFAVVLLCFEIHHTHFVGFIILEQYVLPYLHQVLALDYIF